MQDHRETEKMMRHNTQRRTATKVRNGQVEKKNKTALSIHYSQVRLDELVIDRQRPGRDHKHFLTIADVRRFIALLPDWEELSVGLDAIVLAEAEDALGWHWDGVVAICAWERSLTQDWDRHIFDEHTEIFDRLGLKYEKGPGNTVRCHFTESVIRGFLLMHILLHELGHHHDRMTTKSQQCAARGEPYAEQYAIKYADQLWDAYFQEFGW